VTSSRSRARVSRAAAAALLAACVALGGCAPKPQATSSAQRPGPRNTAGAARGDSASRPDDPASPCATRLHDLGGLLLHYYALNRKLPDRIEDVAPLADMGVEFSAECPQSGRPYEYVPGGLRSSTAGGLLVLYDAVAAHDGLRWGVFLTPPATGQAPATRVILMSDEVFRSYAPAAP